MFIVQVVGAVKGMESGEGMRIEIQEQVRKLLEEHVGMYGVFEVFATETKTMDLYFKNPELDDRLDRIEVVQDTR